MRATNLPARAKAHDPSPARSSGTCQLRLTESLPLRLMAFVLVPVISTAAIAGIWALSTLETQLERRLQREIEMVARALQLPLATALHKQGSAAIKPALDSAFAIGRVYGAYVYDRNGDLVASSATREPTDSPSDVSNAIASGKRTGQYDEVDGRQVYSYFVPLNGAGGEMIGVLRVTSKRSSLVRYIDALRTHGLVLLALTTLALTGIVLVGYYFAVGRSLTSFARSIHRVGGGELAHRADVRRPREVALLAQRFNEMLDSLDAAETRATREHRTRQTIEQQLRHSERLAIIGGVTAGVAHELGTPLSTVGGHCQRLLRRDDLPAPARDALSAIRGQVLRMELLVRQLLEYGAKQTPKRVCTPAQALIAAAADALGPLVEKTNVSLMLKDENAGVAWGDRVRLEQALINLLRNALQAARERVEVRCRQQDGFLEFIVDDDGAGVSPNIRPRLYEPFVSDKQSTGGTGLGLAICSTVAREHDGALHDTRSPLGGARFVLRITRHPRGDLERTAS